LGGALRCLADSESPQQKKERKELASALLSAFGASVLCAKKGLFRVFELPLLRNTQKHDKKPSRKKARKRQAGFWSSFLLALRPVSIPRQRCVAVVVF
jgi:hypothetical protein